MKLQSLLVLVSTVMASSLGHAAMFSFDANLSIPSSFLTGVTDTREVETDITAIGDLDVYLKITAASEAVKALNGDYVVTLSYGDAFAVLLNRVGARAEEAQGYPDNGLDVILDDQAANGDIHVYRFTLSGNHDTPPDPDYLTPLSGSWVADGRPAGHELDPSSPVTAPLSAFNGLNPNGNWTLTVVDNEVGGQGILLSWGLEITPVPEPAETTIAVGLAALAGAWLIRRHRK